MVAETFNDLVGNTPLVRYATDEVPGCRFWVKLEGYNPTGSVKDRGCLNYILDAKEKGGLSPSQTLLDASSGNMACALAYFGRVLGHPVEVVCGSKLTDDKAAFIKYFGAKLTMVGDFTIQGNEHCRDVIQPSDPEQYYFLDQLHNWANPGAHYESTGPEILRDLPEVQAVAASLGSGGTMHGTARFLKEKAPHVTTITVEAKTGTKLPGTGAFADGDYVTPFIKDGYEKGLFDHRESVSKEEAVLRVGDLAQKGFFVGLQTAGVVEAAVTAVGSLGIKGDVVMISGDSGWKNMAVLSTL